MTHNQIPDSDEDGNDSYSMSSALNVKTPPRRGFTPEDELQMQTAIKRSIEFMKNYGKGRKPYMIDRKAYD